MGTCSYRKGRRLLVTNHVGEMERGLEKEIESFQNVTSIETNIFILRHILFYTPKNDRVNFDHSNGNLLVKRVVVFW